jgi:oligoribonuclease
MKSGLTQKVKESTTTIEDAEQKMLEFVQQHTPPLKCPLAGESLFCV